MTKKPKSKTYHIYGDVKASAYLGSVEAKSGKEAMAKAMIKWEMSDCSVCNYCSDKVEDPEVVSITVEREGFHQTESNDFRDEEIKRLRVENENLKKCLKKTVQRDLNAKSQKKTRMESENLNLCKEHRQESKRSEYDRHNCDHCRLQKENAGLKKSRSIFERENISLKQELFFTREKEEKLARLLREVMIDVRMGNRDLYHEIRRLRPEVKIIVDKGEAE